MRPGQSTARSLLAHSKTSWTGRSAAGDGTTGLAADPLRSPCVLPTDLEGPSLSSVNAQHFQAGNTGSNPAGDIGGWQSSWAPGDAHLGGADHGAPRAAVR